MNLVLTVLEIVAPVFLLGTVGFAWIRLGFEYRTNFVNGLATTLALPCLIFTALVKTEIEPSALSAVALATLTSYGVVGVLIFLLLRMARLDQRTFLAPLIFGNTGNLGLPLALFAFGDQGLGYGVAIFAASAVATFTVGAWMVSGGGSPLRMLREPLVGASLLGALFLWQGWQQPTFLTNTLELIGQMAIPLMLLTLGVAVARLHPGSLGRAMWLSLFRVVICVAVASAVGRWFGLGPTALAVLVLQFTTPVAVTSYLLAEKYGADSQAVAGLVVVSTGLAILVLPVVLAIVI